MVNHHLHARLRGAVTSDSSQNAVVLLDILAQYLPMAVEEALEDIAPLFAAYMAPNGPGEEAHGRRSGDVPGDPETGSR